MEDRRKSLELFERYKDETKERIDHGIEDHRKGYAYLTVTDKDGNPLSDVKITAKQKNHAFRFGANIFMLEELETEQKNQKYKEAFKNLFNMATLPFYWNDLEPEKGKTRYDIGSPRIYRRPTPELCLKFCEQNGIEPREHALAYEHMFPQWLKGLPVNEVKRELERRFREIGERYADRIPTIEVTNEMIWKDGGITAFYRDPEYLRWCYQKAEQYFPYNKLVSNEYTGIFERWYGPHSLYYMQIRDLLEKGRRVDAIGMQFHMFHKREQEYDKSRYYFNPLHLYEVLDGYAGFNKPLQITEVTLSAYSNEAADEAFQAELIEWLYSIWFSHPAMEQIIYWNLPDGYAAFAEPGDMTQGENKFFGGLLRFDLSRKPAYDKLEELIRHRWHTETGAVTNGGGKAHFKGFYGDYEVTLEKGNIKKTVPLSLQKKQSNEFTIQL